MRGILIIATALFALVSAAGAQRGPAFPSPGSNRGPAFPDSVSPTGLNPTNWVGATKPQYTDP